MLCVLFLTLFLTLSMHLFLPCLFALVRTSNRIPDGIDENTFFFFVFLGLHPQHMEFSRLGVELELQLPVYTTATAMPDPSHVCDLHHSSPQFTEWGQGSLEYCRSIQFTLIIQFCWVHYHWATTGTPKWGIFAYFVLETFVLSLFQVQSYSMESKF